ncbi:DNA polymerase III subunit gamma/tau [Thermogemmatispora sp.]|uniref:DNA polymerase III subunit gamma/tau n=1 Tax=Thermogemmatispora sp. TaxID=1968838 RepID=UPI001D55349C|nr:DNA polymerase III subunit gamma/tau [Thermogemmatispora sp.]MBX5451690.1 DNA polymerase III subunit gamma/tau [Thermogemmatispora sp.]
MSSQALYRKWRSQTFEQMVGQEAVVETLKNALSSGKLAHAYLFTGPRGTGKTTTARLLAKTINCQQPRNGEPCNECQQCREITAGTSFDVIEIDAASNRGIDNIRELREKVMVRPTSGKYKVYVLDEAHMLTTEAFNALLKTLEEPPEHAIFVLATTDMHKMPATVISRCQCFYFKRFTTRQIVDHLHYIASQEGVTLEAGAAELIARAAAGGMRDALSLLDQAIAYSGERVTLAQVQAMLGVADPRAIEKLVQAVAAEESAAGLHLIHQLAEEGADLRQVNAQLVEYWRALMLARAGASLAEVLDRSDEEIRQIQELARLFSLEELTGFARICAQNELLQKGLGTPQLALELAFLECLELRRRVQAGGMSLPAASTWQDAGGPSASPASQAAPLSGRGEEIREETSPLRPFLPPSRSAAVSAARSRAETGPATPPSGPTGTIGTGATPGVGAATSSPAATSSTVAHRPHAGSAGNRPASRASSGGTLTLQQVQQSWEIIRRRVSQKNPKAASCLQDFRVVAVEQHNGLPVVVIQAGHQPHYDFLSQGNRHKPVEQALELQFSMKCLVRLLPPGQPPGAPLFGRAMLRREPSPPVTSSPSSESASEGESLAVAAPHPATAPDSTETEAKARPPQPADAEALASSPLARNGSVTENDKERRSEGREPPAETQEPAAPPSPESPASNRPLAANNQIPPSASATDAPQEQRNGSLPPPAVLREKASSDPRVQEVIKTFNAEIVDIDIEKSE